MTNSRTVGPFRVRPQIRNGVSTGKFTLDIPASLTGTGKRKRKLFDTRKVALEVAKRLARRLDPATGALLPLQQNAGLSVREAVSLWAGDEQLRVDTGKKRASTLEVEGYRLRSVVRFMGELDLAAVSERTLVEYQRWRLQQGRHPRTINSDLGSFALVLRWAVKRGYRPDVPRAEQVPVQRARTVIPTAEEVVRILEALPQRLRLLVRFIAETGSRRGEAVHLTWDCVDEVNGYVEIRPRGGWTPKTASSERIIPIGRGLLEQLRELPKDGVYVFPGRTPDQPIGNFRKALKAAVDQADIRRRGERVHVTAQTLRKAHATWQAMRGINESVLQDLLGHAPGSRVTRRYYVHATEEAKRAAVIQLPFGEHQANN